MTEAVTVDRVAVARAYVDEVFNGRDAERAREFFTPDVAWHGGALGTITGIDTLIPVLDGFISALTDIKSVVQDVIASDDLVALRLLATGRTVQWDAVDIYRVTEDGKISEQWAFEDLAAILSQVGAVSLPWAG